MASAPSFGAWFRPQDPQAFGWASVPGLWRFLLHFGGAEGRALVRAARHIAAVEPLAPADLQRQMQHCRALLHKVPAKPELLESVLLDAVALLVNLSRQTLQLQPSVPHIAATIAICRGRLIQLAPGEGKTLAIAMAGVILAWQGRPCHVVTANEYLAERDAILMQALYGAAGVSVCSVTHATAPQDLRASYQHAVVYATAAQYLADFLRDDLLLDGAQSALTRGLWGLRQGLGSKPPATRGMYAAIIDEADSVLVDEATTPLIIANAEQDRSEMVVAIQVVRELLEYLHEDIDYSIYLHPVGHIEWNDAGRQKLRKLASHFSSYWQRENRLEDLFKTALLAREQFILDKHYIVQDGEVVIVDDSTGRVMPGRKWSQGIHQAVEAKEGIAPTAPTRTVARMTFQEYFRHYHVLGGASGTLHGLDIELWRTYGATIFRIAPKNKSQLRVLPRQNYRTKAEKLAGLITRVQQLHSQGVPILVGTRRIQDSEDIALALRQNGYTCDVLNAKQHKQEAAIIARAGRLGAITIATNMAGRGTDIGIDAQAEPLGGLQVLMFDPHESARVDWQLFGRAGRQGARGCAQAFASMEDELLVRFLPASLKPLLRPSVPDAVLPLLMGFLLWLAQWRAQRLAARQRRHMAELQEELRKLLSFTRWR